MDDATLAWVLKSLADLEISVGGEAFLGWPDRWYEARHMRCRNDHISTSALVGEGRSRCLACLEPLYLTFPEDDADGPLTIAIIRRLRWLVSLGKTVPLIFWHYGPRRVEAEVIEVRPIVVPSVLLRFIDRDGKERTLETTRAHRIGDVSSQAIDDTSGHWLERPGAEALGWFWPEPEGTMCPCGCESLVSYSPAGEPTHLCPKCKHSVHRRPDRRIASHTIAWVDGGGDLPVGAGCTAWGYTPEQVRARIEQEKIDAQRRAQNAERRRLRKERLPWNAKAHGEPVGPFQVYRYEVRRHARFLVARDGKVVSGWMRLEEKARSWAMKEAKR